jgi:hypothetical protein
MSQRRREPAMFGTNYTAQERRLSFWAQEALNTGPLALESTTLLNELSRYSYKLLKSHNI